MKRIKNLRPYLPYLWIILALYIVLGKEANECLHVRSSSRPTNIIQQTPNSISTRFELIKEHKNISSYDIAIKKETAFVTGIINDKTKLFSLDLTTGQLNWQVCANGAMIVGSEYVFTSYSYLRGTYVVAYDQRSGTEVWREKVDFRRSVSDLTITPFGLLVKTADRSSERFYLLNLETGKQEKSFKTEANRQKFWIENGFTVYRVTGYNEIVARGLTEWQTQVNYDSYFDIDSIELVSDDDNVIVANKDSNTIAQIAVLDKVNGTILWQISTNIQSNVVIDDGILFFVTGDSELMAFDLQTGQLLGSVTFTPGVDEIAGRNTRVLIAANADRIAVYFSSSYQLFVFRFA